jgi:hypothetical protein
MYSPFIANRYQYFGQDILFEAGFHTWPASMQKLMDGYEEVIVAKRSFVAA